MKDTPIISVIIPVYNVEQYLKQCVESIVNQYYTKWELLLVDDGSKDKSGEICDEFVLADQRIKVFHVKNGGPSRARNKGINEATGKYIVFVDSDDWVDPNYLKDLFYANLEIENDWVVSSYRTCYFEKNKQSIKECALENVFFDFSEKAQAFQFLDLSGIFFTNVAKLYRTEVIKQNNIFFNERYTLAEDTLFNFNYLQYINGSIRVLNYINYNYRQIVGAASLIKKYNPQVLEVGLLLLSKRYEWAKMFSNEAYDIKLKERELSLVVSSVLNLYKKDAKLSVDDRLFELKRIRKSTEKFLFNNIGVDVKYRIILYLLLKEYYSLLDVLLINFYRLK